MRKIELKGFGSEFIFLVYPQHFRANLFEGPSKTADGGEKASDFEPF